MLLFEISSTCEAWIESASAVASSVASVVMMCAGANFIVFCASTHHHWVPTETTYATCKCQGICQLYVKLI